MENDERRSFRLDYKHSFKNAVLSMSSLTVYRTGFQKCAKNYHRGKEVRPFYLIHYVIKGKGVLYEEGRAFPVKAGESFIIIPGVEIDYRSDREDPWEYCWVGFNGSDAKLLVSATGFSKDNPVLHHRVPEKVYECLSLIYEARGNDNHDIVKMSAYLYLLFSVLIEERPSAALPGNSEKVIEACEFIKNNYSRNISVEDVAEEVNISRSMLYRLFIDRFDISPKEYILDYRVKEACKLLVKTDSPVKEVASAVGFVNSQHFSVVFRKIMHFTPSGYREMMREIECPHS